MESFKTLCFVATEANIRLDKYITAQSPEELTRSYLQKLISEGLVFINDGTAKASYKTRIGDTITIHLPLIY